MIDKSGAARLLLLLGLLLGTGQFQNKVEAVQAAKPCRLHTTCGRDSFCNSAPQSNGTFGDGLCEPCHKCCLRPERYDFPATPNLLGVIPYGRCTLWCGCNLNQPCNNGDLPCGPGLFCKAPRDYASIALPTCQPCTRCLTDADDCALHCPAGPIGDLLSQFGINISVSDASVAATAGYGVEYDAGNGGNAAPPAALSALMDAIVDLSFELQQSVRPQASPGLALVPAEAVAALLGRSEYLQAGGSPGGAPNGSEVALVLSNMYDSTHTPAGEESLPLIGLASILSGAARSLLCPRLYARQPPSRLPRLSSLGCPCSSEVGAAHSRCPAGALCSRRAFRALPTDDPAVLQLRAVCVPCAAGQYCAEGSTEAQAEDGPGLDCPAGFYCPTPADLIACPAGSYCAARAVAPASCAWGGVVIWINDALGAGQNGSGGGNRSWIERLRSGGGPIRGNYCPQRSTTPDTKCPGGNYCPNASIQIPCPPGHYCKPQSTYPIECPPLVACPAGTAYAKGYRIAGLLYALVLAGTCMSLLSARLLVHIFQVVARYYSALRSIIEGAGGHGGNARREATGAENGNDGAADAGRGAAAGAAPAAGPVEAAALAAHTEYNLDNPDSKSKQGGRQAIAKANPGASRRTGKSAVVQLLDRGIAGRLGVTEARFDIEFRNVRGRLQRSSADKDKGPAGKRRQQAASGGASISGTLRAGSVNAIMGPSGCGKSALIKVLSGRMLPAVGISVEAGVGGPPASPHEAGGGVCRSGAVLSATRYRRLLGFVPQEDVLHANLTVRENMEYAAYLSMRPGTPTLARHAVVYAFLRELQLHHRQDFVVGSEQNPYTSGGERKRVNIGAGMVSLPPVLFLDEPTSGLDAATSVLVIQLMADLAHHVGVNVITVLHQPRPDCFDALHHVMLLANDGMVVYEGSPQECKQHFRERLGFGLLSEDQGMPIADIIMDVASGNSSQTSSIGISGKDLSFVWLADDPEIRRRAEARMNKRTDGSETMEASLHVADGKLEARRKERARRIFIKLLKKQGGTARSAESQLNESEEALFEEAYGALTSAGAASGNCGGFIRLLQVDGEDMRSRRHAMAAVGEVKQGASTLTTSSTGSQLNDSEEAMFEEAYGSLTSSGADSGDHDGFIRLLQVEGVERHRDSTAAAATAATVSATADGGARRSAAHTIAAAAAVGTSRALAAGIFPHSSGPYGGEGVANPGRAGCDHDGGALERPSSYDRRGTASRRQGVLLSTEEDRGRAPSGPSSSKGDEHGGGGGGASGEQPDRPMLSSERAGSPPPAAAASFPTPGVTGPPEAGDRAGAPAGPVEERLQPPQQPAGDVTLRLCLGLREPLEVPVPGRLEAPLQLALAPPRPAPDGVSDVQWTLFQLFGIVMRNIHATARLFWVTMLDVWLLLSAAFIVGVLQGNAWELRDVPANVSMAYLVQAVLNAVVHLRVFTSSRNVQRHEVSRGVSAAALYVASLITDLGWIVLSPAVYYSVYHFVVVPRASFSAYYTVGLLVCWWSSGLSYTVSLSFIPPQAQLLFTVVVILLIGAFLHGLSPSIASARGSALKVLLGLSYNRWAMEAATIQEFRHYGYRSMEVLALYYDKGICGVDEKVVDDGDNVVSPREAFSLYAVQKDYADDGCQRYYTQACAALFGMGLGWRALAFLQIWFASYRLRIQVRCECYLDRLVAVAKALCCTGAAGAARMLLHLITSAWDTCAEEHDMLWRYWVAAWYRWRMCRDGDGEDAATAEIEAACREGQAEALDELLRAGTQLSKEELGGSRKVEYKPLEEAIRNGHTAVVRVLMSWDENVLDTLVGGMPPLHFACYRGQCGVVELLLREACASPDEQDRKGNRPMHVAVREGHSQVVELLLREDPGQLDSSNADDKTPLLLACDRKQLSVVNVMLQHLWMRESIEVVRGMPLLHFACYRGMHAVVELLLQETSASPDKQDIKGNRPMHVAAREGHSQVVELLLREDPGQLDIFNKDGKTPLYMAAQNGHLGLVRALLDAGANIDAPSKDGRTSLYTAAQDGQLVAVRTLLDAGANKDAPDEGGRTPLYTAAQNGHLEVVQTLLAAGANKDAPDKDGWTPLYTAAQNGRLEVVRTLLDAGANKFAPSKGDGWTPLHTAAFFGHLEVVRLLLHTGANNYAPDKYGRTPLHEAAMLGYLEMVRLLLHTGANNDAPDKDGTTPLYTATRNGHLEVVQTLLAAGANKDAPDKGGSTPLYTAAQNGHLEMVQTLLAAGANKDAPDKDGRTPMHSAAKKGHLEVVRTLLAAGANKDAPSKGGSTPLHTAAQNGHLKVVQALLAAGANKDAPDKRGRTALHVARNEDTKRALA